MLTVGPDAAADAIKKALQMGADEGVHVNDDAIHGSDAVATSLVLAEAVKKATGGAPTSSSPAWRPPTAAWAWCPRCSPSGSGCRRSPSPPSSPSATAR